MESCNLFALIKSLSKSEKGYFKKYSTFNIRKKEKINYIKIFDAIDSQKEYSEPKLLKKFKGELFIKQFAVAKNYLYDILLESLESYNKTATIELRSSLNQVDVLIGKGLYVQAKKILRKAKKAALMWQKLSYIAEINLMEQSIYHLQNDAEGLSKQVEILNDEIKKTAQQINDIACYEELKSRIYLQSFENTKFYDHQEVGKLDLLMEKVVFEKDQQLSPLAEIRLKELKCSYYEYIGDVQNAYNCSVELMNISLENSLVFKRNMDFLTLCCDHCIRCCKVDMHEEAIEMVRYLERAEPGKKLQINTLQLMVFYAKLMIYFKTGELSKCLDLIPEINRVIDNKQTDLLLKEKICWTVILSLMIAEQYKTALSWFIKINQGNFLQKGLTGMSHIIELILHYELEKYDVIEYRVKSARRFLLKKTKQTTRQYEFENAFLLLFQYLGLSVDKRINASLPEKIKSLLELQTTAFLKSNSFIHKVITSWLACKMSGQKLRAIFFAHHEQIITFGNTIFQTTDEE